MSGFEDDFQAWRKSWVESLRDDFAELSRYRDANAGLKAPSPNEGRVVFFGDSIAEGWRLDEYFPRKPYINRGICSQTTSQMLIRFRQDAVALRPRAVVIHAGTNDIGGNTGPMRLEDIEANLASMAEIAHANGVPIIFSSLLPPPHKSTPLSRYNLLKHPPEKTRALNRWLKDYSAAHGCGFLDYTAALSSLGGFLKREFSEDGLHPTAAGYLVMAGPAGAAIGVAELKWRRGEPLARETAEGPTR
ncbi:MAG: GDSL-type esterase/lipase family protein [Rhodomicrobium sp.]